MRARAVLAATLLVVGLAACSDDSGGSASTTTASAADGTTTTTVPAGPVVPAPPSPAPTEPPPAFGEATEPVVIGHRGAAHHFPDNSIDGFAGAAQLGADWVELDVRLSADGDVYLSHDLRTAAGSAVAATSSADLADEGLATLVDALEVIDANHLGVDVEIKSIPTEEGYDPTLAIVDATMAVLRSRPIEGPIVVSSFDRLAIDRVRELTGDDFDTALITQGIGGADDLAASLLDGGHDGLAIGDPALPRSVIHTFTDAGLTVWSWTIDGPQVARRLVARGADGIITDVPDRISRALS